MGKKNLRSRIKKKSKRKSRQSRIKKSKRKSRQSRIKKSKRKSRQSRIKSKRKSRQSHIKSKRKSRIKKRSRNSRRKKFSIYKPSTIPPKGNPWAAYDTAVARQEGRSMSSSRAARKRSSRRDRRQTPSRIAANKRVFKQRRKREKERQQAAIEIERARRRSEQAAAATILSATNYAASLGPNKREFGWKRTRRGSSSGVIKKKGHIYPRTGQRAKESRSGGHGWIRFGDKKQDLKPAQKKSSAEDLKLLNSGPQGLIAWNAKKEREHQLKMIKLEENERKKKTSGEHYDTAMSNIKKYAPFDVETSPVEKTKMLASWWFFAMQAFMEGFGFLGVTLGSVFKTILDPSNSKFEEERQTKIKNYREQFQERKEKLLAAKKRREEEKLEHLRQREIAKAEERDYRRTQKEIQLNRRHQLKLARIAASNQRKLDIAD